ncbi:hypothetical protein JYU29_05875 [Tianweitania sp. BSSL-BM11]|uniref:Integrase n=1 Tax=Tianweitania aestuarii TaxID=2814886 RepID=A0ABS5RTT0_9HYPH|nr:hypothetical protein [Tianweitania aestuarii]MBS9720215.1 hypothetical protein [Tianweitania aestuarii]
MARIKLKHYVVRKGKYGYWLPTPKMQEFGFRPITCGPDGPDAWKIAQEWEDKWQAARKGIETSPALRHYPKDSVGDAFERYRKTESWKTRLPRTREDWERGWSFIDKVFGDQPPAAVTFELLDTWYHALVRKNGIDVAYRAVKTWRSLYRIMAGMKLCPAGQDPSLAIRRKNPKPRTETWSEGEVVRLVKGCWRRGFKGLACIIAIAWDTSFSPVDVRTLTPGQIYSTGNDKEWGFLIARTKTGEAAYGTLSARTRRMVTAYLDGLGATVMDDAPLFRSRGFTPTGMGGRPRPPTPYTKNSLVDDFADLRRIVFGPEEKRRFMDMRRSGAVEANAGGANVESIAAKMGNSIDENKALQKTYMPVNLVAVRTADEHRRIGRRQLSEQTGLKKLKLPQKKS